eukprot:TRINITY_DN5302_c0_g1_i1.p1 TRINITY_DN5302_c0_g1~~TRINITY_DN5302_c0_g1_i1.p1  ORF type:complete len:716 (-),score=101.64 TRINITY_DN5302_c0_g1_i1:139-2286(-)
MKRSREEEEGEETFPQPVVADVGAIDEKETELPAYSVHLMNTHSHLYTVVGIVTEALPIQATRGRDHLLVLRVADSPDDTESISIRIFAYLQRLPRNVQVGHFVVFHKLVCSDWNGATIGVCRMTLPDDICVYKVVNQNLQQIFPVANSLVLEKSELQRLYRCYANSVQYADKAGNIAASFPGLPRAPTTNSSSVSTVGAGVSRAPRAVTRLADIVKNTDVMTIAGTYKKVRFDIIVRVEQVKTTNTVMSFVYVWDGSGDGEGNAQGERETEESGFVDQICMWDACHEMFQEQLDYGDWFHMTNMTVLWSRRYSKLEYRSGTNNFKSVITKLSPTDPRVVALLGAAAPQDISTVPGNPSVSTSRAQDEVTRLGDIALSEDVKELERAKTSKAVVYFNIVVRMERLKLTKASFVFVHIWDGSGVGEGNAEGEHATEEPGLVDQVCMWDSYRDYFGEDEGIICEGDWFKLENMEVKWSVKNQRLEYRNSKRSKITKLENDDPLVKAALAAHTLDGPAIMRKQLVQRGVLINEIDKEVTEDIATVPIEELLTAPFCISRVNATVTAFEPKDLRYVSVRRCTVAQCDNLIQEDPTQERCSRCDTPLTNVHWRLQLLLSSATAQLTVVLLDNLALRFFRSFPSCPQSLVSLYDPSQKQFVEDMRSFLEKLIQTGNPYEYLIMKMHLRQRETSLPPPYKKFAYIVGVGGEVPSPGVEAVYS